MLNLENVIAEKAIDQLISVLNKDTFGGVYWDGNAYVITTTDEQVIGAKIKTFQAQRNDTDKFSIIHVKHSLNDLEKARDIVMDFSQKYEVIGVGIHSENNTIVVWTKNLSDENKAQINEITGLENIIFKQGYDIIMHDEFIEAPNEEELSENSDMTANALITPGYWVGKQGVQSTTLAISAKQNAGTASQKTGYITCGHGYAAGNSIYYQKTTYLGAVVKSVKNTVADAAFIQSTLSPARQNRYGHTIDYQGNAKVGETILVEGVTGGSQTSEVTATNAVIEFTDPSGNKQLRRNVMAYTCMGYAGNSGAAIFQVDDNTGEYTIVEIQSSAMVANQYTECFATQWNYVASQLNITASYW